MLDILDKLINALHRAHAQSTLGTSLSSNASPESTEEIRDLLGQWSGLTRTDRQKVVDGLPVEARIALLAFADKMAVFGVREERTDLIFSGLVAVAVSDYVREDPRDVLMTLCLLHHSAKKLKADVWRLLMDASSLAPPGTAKIIREFPQYAAASLHSMGFREVYTKDGFDYESVL